MPFFSSQLICAIQLPLTEAGQLLLVTGVAFLVITLISSTNRFHHMIQLSDEDLPTIQSRNDFFFVQVTRYLSKINRQASGFGLLIIQFRTDSPDRLAVQEEFLQKLKGAVRSTSIDKLCLYGDDCVGAIVDTEAAHVQSVAERMTQTVQQIAGEIPVIQTVRIGASCFPTHGLTTRQIIDTANEALETALFDATTPLCIAAPPEEEPAPDARPTNESGEAGEISKNESSSILDPLTGVLKPSLIGSYMRKYLAELRQKKKPAALLCVGINRLEAVRELHGEEICDDVIAGVSQILQKLTRTSDLIGRYENEAFLILMTCTLDEGGMIAQRLRDAISKEVFFSNGRRIKTSISIGVSAHPEHGRYLRHLFHGAHTALKVLREWNTSACLIYNAAQHDNKGSA